MDGEDTAIPDRWADAGARVGEDGDGGGVVEWALRLGEPGLDGFALGVEFGRGAVEGIEEEDNVGAGKAGGAADGADSNDGVGLAVNEEGKVAGLEVGGRVAGGVRDLDVEEDAVAGTKAVFTLVVGAGDEGDGWRIWGRSGVGGRGGLLGKGGQYGDGEA